MFLRQQSSLTATLQNLRDAPNVFDTKANDQRPLGRKATGIGVRDPRARLRPLRRLTPSFSSVWILQFLGIHDHAFGLQQHADPEVAEPTPHSANRLHLFANFWIVRRFVAPDGLGIDTNKPARPALRDVVIPHRRACCGLWRIRCRQVFPGKSFRTTLSNMVSAKRGVSFEVSSPSDLRRWVSDTFLPPYLALNL